MRTIVKCKIITTPHWHWFQNYKSYHVPICWATNEVVYSTGRGQVLFTPIIDGKTAQGIIFAHVLHVPALQNNLLAVLHLTTHHNLSINIVWNHISFFQDQELCFCVTVWNGIGFLTENTVPNHEHSFLLDTDHRWISDKSVLLRHPPLYLLSPKSIPISVTSPTPLHSSLSPLFTLHPYIPCFTDIRFHATMILLSLT